MCAGDDCFAVSFQGANNFSWSEVNRRLNEWVDLEKLDRDNVKTDVDEKIVDKEFINVKNILKIKVERYEIDTWYLYLRPLILCHGHLLVHCVFAREFWFILLRQVGLHSVSPQPSELSFLAWWEKASSSTTDGGKELIRLLFLELGLYGIIAMDVSLMEQLQT